MVTARRRINSRGFSLAELMVGITVLGIIFALAPKVMLDTYKFFRLSMARSEIQRDARTALDLINRRLRQAQASTVEVSNETGQPPCSKIYFVTISGSTLTFWQDGRDLKWKEGAAASKTLVENVRYMAFTYVETDVDTVVSASLSFEKDVAVGKSKALQMAVEKVRVMNP